MGVTWVIRAEEWITSTPKHVLLYAAFGWEAPRWTHMPLLRNADRSKISKRKNPTSLIWYRDQGFLPEGLLNFLALMGYSLPDGRESAAAGVEREQRARVLREAVSRLPDRQRATLILKIYHDLTHEEVAGVLGSTVGTVKANLFHALANLRKLLGPEALRALGGE